MDLELSTTTLDDPHGTVRAVVAATGELDLETASQLGHQALHALQEVSPHLVLDLHEVSFMDSTGLKVLLAAHRRAELAGGSVVLLAPTRSVSRILELTGLDQTFAVVQDVADLPPVAVSDGAAPTA